MMKDDDLILAEAKNVFLSRMSHDLRNPLNAIVGLAEILQEGVYGEMTEKQSRSLRQIESSGFELLNLIERFTLIQRLVEDLLTVQKSRMNLVDVFAALKSVWRPRLAVRDLVMEVHCDASLGLVDSDSRIIRALSSILLEKAALFIPAGSTVRLEARRSTPTCWTLTVIHGSAELSAQFRSKADPAMSKEDMRVALLRSEGSGLVAATALCQLLGGELSVHSAQDEEQFQVELPG